MAVVTSRCHIRTHRSLLIRSEMLLMSAVERHDCAHRHARTSKEKREHHHRKLFISNQWHFTALELRRTQDSRIKIAYRGGRRFPPVHRRSPIKRGAMMMALPSGGAALAAGCSSSAAPPTACPSIIGSSDCSSPSVSRPGRNRCFFSPRHCSARPCRSSTRQAQLPCDHQAAASTDPWWSRGSQTFTAIFPWSFDREHARDCRPDVVCFAR